MSKKYKVTVKFETWVTKEIEAKNLDDAWDIAEQQAEFGQSCDYDWLDEDIDLDSLDVEEIEGESYE